MVAGAVFFGSPKERGGPDEQEVFRPEWGCGTYARAYPVMGVRMFKVPFHMGYSQVLATGGFSGIPLQNWLPGLVTRAHLELENF